MVTRVRLIAVMLGCLPFLSGCGDIVENTDERYSKLVVGSWRTDRNGRASTLDIRSDGTCTFRQQNSGLEWMVGAMMGLNEFNAEWRIENQRLYITMHLFDQTTTVDNPVHHVDDETFITEDSQGRVVYTRLR